MGVSGVSSVWWGANAVEAKLGDPELVTSLLRSGAKRDQLTSKGRTALQVAETCNVQESHLEVQGLTRGDLGDGK